MPYFFPDYHYFDEYVFYSSEILMCLPHAIKRKKQLFFYFFKNSM